MSVLSTTVIPSSVTSTGAGIPWQTPPGATGSGAGTQVPVLLTSVTISGNVVTFATNTQLDPLVAGEIVTISNLVSSTFLNGQQLTVLSAGLSTTSFSANFTHADQATVLDAGLATPQTSYTFAQNNAGNFPTPTPPHYVTYTVPSGGWSQAFAHGQTLGIGVPGSISETGFGARAFISGYSGWIGAPTTWITSGLMLIPTLPAGAVVTAIYAGAAMSRSGAGGVFLGGRFDSTAIQSGSISFVNLDGVWHWTQLFTPSSAPLTDLSALSTSYFGAAGAATTNGTFDYGMVADFAIAVVYTLSSGSPTPDSQLETLNAFPNCSLDVPGYVVGVEVDADSGVISGTSSLTVQLTLGGTPIGTPKTLNPSTWTTPYVLGGPSDLWGLTSLSGAQVSGCSGLGAVISGTLSSGAQVNLNALRITVWWSRVRGQVWVSVGNTRPRGS